jgi:hypothetical protein
MQLIIKLHVPWSLASQGLGGGQPLGQPMLLLLLDTYSCRTCMTILITIVWCASRRRLVVVMAQGKMCLRPLRMLLCWELL